MLTDRHAKLVKYVLRETFGPLHPDVELSLQNSDTPYISIGNDTYLIDEMVIECPTPGWVVGQSVYQLYRIVAEPAGRETDEWTDVLLSVSFADVVTRLAVEIVTSKVKRTLGGKVDYLEASEWNLAVTTAAEPVTDLPWLPGRLALYESVGLIELQTAPYYSTGVPSVTARDPGDQSTSGRYRLSDLVRTTVKCPGGCGDWDAEVVNDRDGACHVTCPRCGEVYRSQRDLNGYFWHFGSNKIVLPSRRDETSVE